MKNQKFFLLFVLVSVAAALWYWFKRGNAMFVTQEGIDYHASGTVADYLRDQAVSATVTAPAPSGPEVYIASLDNYFTEEDDTYERMR